LDSPQNGVGLRGWVELVGDDFFLGWAIESDSHLASFSWDVAIVPDPWWVSNP